jgi:hypothetical protein
MVSFVITAWAPAAHWMNSVSDTSPTILCAPVRRWMMPAMRASVSPAPAITTVPERLSWYR